MSQIIEDCNVCVIGGAGFLGSHLVNHLVEDRRCEVLVLDNLITGLRKHVHKDATFKWCDIRDETEQLTGLLDEHQTQFVFNYAAEPYIPECWERPMHFFDINAVSVLRVLTACQRADVQRILQVSSAEIYGDATGKITEDHFICPHSTYGVSKLAADGLVQVRWHEAKVPAIALRQFNCIGERETHEYVVPEIISQLSRWDSRRGDYPKIYLGNNTTRDFLYAGDAVRMAVDLLEHGIFGEVYNMGSEHSITIYDLANRISRLMGFKEELKISASVTRKRPWDIWHLQSHNGKLYDAIQTRPHTTLNDALQRTIDYFVNNGNKWDW